VDNPWHLHWLYASCLYALEYPQHSCPSWVSHHLPEIRACLDGRARGLAFRLAEQEAEIRAHAGRLRWLTLAQAARRDQAWYDADRPGYLRAAAEALEAFSARVRLSRD
jgi:hypothetical protein